MPPAKPVVSIIMPVYNGAKFIAASIDSVRQQTFKNWELLIINDASTDTTEQVVATFTAQDPRIKLITSPPTVALARHAIRALPPLKVVM